MAQPDLHILIPPGGPSGPFWGVMRQSGLIIATQMQERDTAESLIAVLNIIDGDFDFDTVESAVREYKKIWESDPDPGAEDYLIKQLGRALGGAAKELTGNGG